MYLRFNVLHSSCFTDPWLSFPDWVVCLDCNETSRHMVLIALSFFFVYFLFLQVVFWDEWFKTTQRVWTQYSFMQQLLYCDKYFLICYVQISPNTHFAFLASFSCSSDISLKLLNLISMYCNYYSYPL